MTAIGRVRKETPRIQLSRLTKGISITALVAVSWVGVARPAAAQAPIIEYYHLDAVGNVRAVTNQAGQVVERHDYLPFGEECTTGPCAGNPGVDAGQPRKFTGKERDVETGLDYFGARYYGSKIGRFTTTDPVYTWQENLVDPQRWNRYAYARNNPLRYTDPDGRAINLVAGGIGAGIGGVAGFVGSAWAQHAQGGAFVWQDAWAAAAGGAVSGGLAGLTLGGSLAAQGGIGAVVAIGAGTNAVGGAVTRSLDSSEGTRPGDFKEVAIDLGVGCSRGRYWGEGDRCLVRIHPSARGDRSGDEGGGKSRRCRLVRRRARSRRCSEPLSLRERPQKSLGRWSAPRPRMWLRHESGSSLRRRTSDHDASCCRGAETLE